MNRCILCPFHHQIVPGSGAKIALIHQTCSSSFKPCCEGENRVGGLQGFLLLLPTGWILNMTPRFRVSRVSAPPLFSISFLSCFFTPRKARLCNIVNNAYITSHQVQFNEHHRERRCRESGMEDGGLNKVISIPLRVDTELLACFLTDDAKWKETSQGRAKLRVFRGKTARKSTQPSPSLTRKPCTACS